ncbi:MAG: alpha/beta hydrolase [Actinomycetota bacterium]|nr:alpha/beta hydrolase [Actinomycetota bacterium]
MEFAVAVPGRGTVVFDDLVVYHEEGIAWHSACVSRASYKVIARSMRLKVTVKDSETGRKVTPRSVKTINGNFVRLFTWQLSYSDAGLIGTPEAVPPMAQLWRAAGNAAAGHATATDRAVLAGMANGLVAKGTLPNVPQDNLFSAGWAFSCGDQAWPRSVKTYARNTAADRTAFPLTAGAPGNIAPCSAWPVHPKDPEPTVQPIGKRNVLILQNERDPSTPLRSAQGMRRAMGSDAALVTVDAGGRGVLVHPQPSACAIGALETYLTGGSLPATDLNCD